MRQSKSLGSLALWSDKSRNASKSHMCDAAAVQEQWPTCANQYELLEDCGKGVSAVVYQARCRSNDKLVAVKALNLETLMCPLEDIMHEAQTMKAYKHNAVLQLYCSFVTGEELWMVMPYMEGGSIAHIMRYKFPDGLQEAVIATIMRKVLEALAYVHKQGDIHRDVKAGNVLVDVEGNVKLGDFGVAATLERDSDWGQTKPRLTFVGTPCWMAPEVLEQTAGYGTAADIWSFGITMLEMAHGHAPFSKLPPMKVLLMTLQGPPPQLEASCGSRHFSRGMREVVARCLNKDPSKRPTAKELLEHRFFKQAKDAEFLKGTLLAGLPPLPQRCNEIRAGKAATLARENDRAAVASHISYITDVAQWDFNCMKGIETGLVPDGQQSSTPNSGRERDQQSPMQLKQHPSLDVLPSGANAIDTPAAAEASNVVRVQSGDVTTAAAGLDQQQRVAGDQAAAVKDATGVSSGDGQLASSYAGVPAVSPRAAAADGAPAAAPAGQVAAAAPAATALAADLADVPAAAAAAAASPASPRLAAYCFSGGKQVATFPVSTPATPDQSPSHSRPTTPEAFAAAAHDVHTPAGAWPSTKPAQSSRPGTAGSVLSAKRHGRFTIIEGSQPYQGPEINDTSGTGLPAPLSPFSRQRSVSTPDIGALTALQLDVGVDSFAAAKPGAVAPAEVQRAAAVAVPPGADASSAAGTAGSTRGDRLGSTAGSTRDDGLGSTTGSTTGSTRGDGLGSTAGSTRDDGLASTAGSTTGSPGRTGLLSRFIADRASKRQQSPAKPQLSPQRAGGVSPHEGRQQQLNIPLLKRCSREPSPSSDVSSVPNSGSTVVGSGTVLTSSLARPASSLSDIYMNTPHGGAAAGSQRSFVQQQQRRQQQHHQHAAAEVWEHVKDVCSEAVAHVAHPFRHAGAGSAYHSPRQASPEVHHTQQQAHHHHQQQQQPADSAESLASAVASRDSCSSIASAASGASSSSKPPRYQQGSLGALRIQQQQQQGGLHPQTAATNSTAALAGKHRKSVSFADDTAVAALQPDLEPSVCPESAPSLAESANAADSKAATAAAAQVQHLGGNLSMQVVEQQQQQQIQRQQQQAVVSAARSELEASKQPDLSQLSDNDAQVSQELSFSVELADTYNAVAAANAAGAAALKAAAGAGVTPAAGNSIRSPDVGGSTGQQQLQQVGQQLPAAVTGVVTASILDSSGGPHPSASAAAAPSDAVAPHTAGRNSSGSSSSSNVQQLEQQHSSGVPVHKPEVTLMMQPPAEPAAAAAAVTPAPAPAHWNAVKMSHRGRFTITET